MKKLISLLLVLSFVFSLSIPAFAADSAKQVQHGSAENIHYEIEYSINNSVVTERIIFRELGSAPTILERNISPSGQMLVYINGELKRSVFGAEYAAFLDAARDPIAYNRKACAQHPLPYPSSANTTLPCGFDAVHTQLGESIKFTYNISRTTTIADIAEVISSQLGPLPEFTVNFITLLLKDAIDRNAEYVDVTETRFMIQPEGYDDAQICHHVLYSFYNLSSSGKKEFLINEWDFYTTPMSDYA